MVQDDAFASAVRFQSHEFSEMLPAKEHGNTDGTGVFGSHDASVGPLEFRAEPAINIGAQQGLICEREDHGVQAVWFQSAEASLDGCSHAIRP